MKRRALITGITGQDGSYLAEYLLSLDYEVHGMVRRIAVEDPRSRFSRIHHLLDRIHLHAATLENFPSIYQMIAKQPFDECYHLAAQSYVADSFLDGFSTMKMNVLGTHYVLEAIKELQPACRVYFAGSSEMFGRARQVPQTELTPFHPRSPYGISKVAGFDLTRNYRESYDMHCCSGVLFNHESPRRGKEFVTRKITSAVARIKFGLTDKLYLGKLDARRDWGHAAEYVVAMHQMLQQDEPDDFVIATGETHSVRDFCEAAFQQVNLDYRDFVEIDPGCYRPADVDLLIGDASKAHDVLGWNATTNFLALVSEMVAADMELVRKEVEGLPVPTPHARIRRPFSASSKDSATS